MNTECGIRKESDGTKKTNGNTIHQRNRNKGKRNSFLEQSSASSTSSHLELNRVQFNVLPLLMGKKKPVSALSMTYGRHRISENVLFVLRIIYISEFEYRIEVSFANSGEWGTTRLKRRGKRDQRYRWRWIIINVHAAAIRLSRSVSLTTILRFTKVDEP